MIDAQFILNTLEGTVQEGDNYIGHVPPVGRSGVTIANGFDLGQHNKQDLIKYNLGEDLNKKLEPFLLKNLKNTDLKELQKLANTLVITKEEADKINANVLNWNIKETEKEYNNLMSKIKDKNYVTRFAQLPEKLQTLLVQNKYITGNIKNYPKLYTGVATNNKEQILNAINLNKDYNPKRKKDLISYMTQEENEEQQKTLVPEVNEINIELKQKPQVPNKEQSLKSELAKRRAGVSELY